MAETRPRYYFVGGCVRDIYVKHMAACNNIDIAAECASYEIMKQDFLNTGGSICKENPEFCTFKGRHPTLAARLFEKKSEKAQYVELSLCRKSGHYNNIVVAGNILDDLARRDFTQNAMAVNLVTGEFLDPHNGQEDMKRGILKAVGDAKARFAEDPLRILRAVRFMITGHLLIDTATEQALLSNVSLITSLSKERVVQELRKAFEVNTLGTLNLLIRYGLLSLIFAPNNGGGIWLTPYCAQKVYIKSKTFIH